MTICFEQFNSFWMRLSYNLIEIWIQLKTKTLKYALTERVLIIYYGSIIINIYNMVKFPIMIKSDLD